MYLTIIEALVKTLSINVSSLDTTPTNGGKLTLKGDFTTQNPSTGKFTNNDLTLTIDGDKVTIGVKKFLTKKYHVRINPSNPRHSVDAILKVFASLGTVNSLGFQIWGRLNYTIISAARLQGVQNILVREGRATFYLTEDRQKRDLSFIYEYQTPTHISYFATNERNSDIDQQVMVYVVDLGPKILNLLAMVTGQPTKN